MADHVSSRAQADLDHIWYSSTKKAAAPKSPNRQIDAITERFHLLGDHPFAGRARDDELGPGRRSFPVDRYIIVYRVTGRDADILRVAGSSQDIKALMGRR